MKQLASLMAFLETCLSQIPPHTHTHCTGVKAMFVHSDLFSLTLSPCISVDWTRIELIQTGQKQFFILKELHE
jgi:hypothetical protein